MEIILTTVFIIILILMTWNFYIIKKMNHKHDFMVAHFEEKIKNEIQLNSNFTNQTSIDYICLLRFKISILTKQVLLLTQIANDKTI
uniref:hypothetical protein n=1 Tax=Flavobacterium sp. TaxID=239 RepID=UPI00404ABDF4